jgi:hypothetical protein
LIQRSLTNRSNNIDNIAESPVDASNANCHQLDHRGSTTLGTPTTAGDTLPAQLARFPAFPGFPGFSRPRKIHRQR